MAETCSSGKVLVSITRMRRRTFKGDVIPWEFCLGDGFQNKMRIFCGPIVWRELKLKRGWDFSIVRLSVEPSCTRSRSKTAAEGLSYWCTTTGLQKRSTCSNRPDLPSICMQCNQSSSYRRISKPECWGLSTPASVANRKGVGNISVNPSPHQLITI